MMRKGLVAVTGFGGGLASRDLISTSWTCIQDIRRALVSCASQREYDSHGQHDPEIKYTRFSLTFAAWPALLACRKLCGRRPSRRATPRPLCLEVRGGFQGSEMMMCGKQVW